MQYTLSFFIPYFMHSQTHSEIYSLYKNNIPFITKCFAGGKIMISLRRALSRQKIRSSDPAFLFQIQSVIPFQRQFLWLIKLLEPIMEWCDGIIPPSLQLTMTTNFFTLSQLTLSSLKCIIINHLFYGILHGLENQRNKLLKFRKMLYHFLYPDNVRKLYLR